MTTLLSLLPLLASILLTLAALRAPQPRSAILILGSVTILASLLDWLMLSLLPALHLSYGPFRPPAFLLNFLRMLMLGLAVILIGWIHAGSGKAGIAWVVGILQGFLLIISFYGLYIEPFRLGVSTLNLQESPAFLADRPLRILQISDTHLEHPSPREADLLLKVKTLQPDLIVLTGDYVNTTYLHDEQSLAETRQLFSQLDAPFGVYAVNGSVDSQRVMSALFSGLENIRVLNDEVELVSFPAGTLALVGVTSSNHRSTYRDGQALEMLMADIPADMYTLLLYHTPDLIDIAAKTGVDLYLAGHTHGGQIRLPFYGAIITFSKFGKQFEMGQYQVENTTLYVSRGIGMEGGRLPRVRFLCPPELVLVQLGKIPGLSQ